MEPSSPRNSSAPFAVPLAEVNPYPDHAFAYQQYQPTGRSPDGRRVQPLTSQAPATSSFMDVLGRNSPSILHSPTNSPRRRGLENDLDGEDPGSDRKLSKHATSRHNLTPLTLPPPLRAGSPRLGFIYGRASSESKFASSPPPALSQRDIPAHQPFTVTASELERLRATTTRTLVEVSSSSVGTYVVRFEDPPASAQAPGNGVPLPAPVERQAEELARAGEEPHGARAGEQDDPPGVRAEAAPSFDPVNSKFAKTLRSRLRKELTESADHKVICSRLLRRCVGDMQLLGRNRWAFTPEFLVAVLRVLPDLKSSQVETLGKAVGCLGVPVKGHSSYYASVGSLGGPAREVIGQALAHEGVQSHVPLDRLIDFLLSADQTGARKDKNREYPQRRFSAVGAAHGIPLALGKRLGREAQDDTSVTREVVRATTGRLASMLGKSMLKHPSLDAVNQGIDASPAPAAVKKWLKDEFRTAFLLPADNPEGDDLSDVEGS